MTEENIYQTPQSSVLEENNAEALASRWSRLGAAILDAIIAAIVVVPIAFSLGIFEALMASVEAGADAVGTQYTITMAIVGLGTFFLLNGYWLATKGQTVGKKLVGIKIVTMDRQLPAFGKLIALRYLPLWMVTYLPMVGGILPLIDVVFIFRSDKRCVHDLIAGTQVVNC